MVAMGIMKSTAFTLGLHYYGVDLSLLCFFSCLRAVEGLGTGLILWFTMPVKWLNLEGSNISWQVFQSWGFYRERLMQEGAEYGWPVTRHMMLHFPTNPRVYQEELTRQFMLGDSLLVAPVLEAGQSSVSVFLPMGSSWSLIWGPATNVIRGNC